MARSTKPTESGTFIQSVSRRRSATQPALAPTARIMNPPTPDDRNVTSTIRLRLGPHDVRYGGRLVAGATAMEIFGDLATEIGIRTGGDEALSVGYDSVEFLAPLHSGDFVEGRARIVGVGRTSRRIEAVIYIVISADDDGVGVVHEPPILAARATTTIVSMFRDRGSSMPMSQESAAAPRSASVNTPSPD